MIVDIKGRQIEIDISGPENGAVVILCHSLKASLRAWDELTKALSSSFRVLRYSLRGHGKTDPVPGLYSLEGLAEDIADIQDHFGIEKSHVIGLSIGGMIAQTFALEYPDRVEKLVISSSFSALPDGGRELWIDRIENTDEDRMTTTVEPTIERWFTTKTLQNNGPLIDKTRAIINETTVVGFVGCCHAISNIDLTDRLPAITAPTLVVVGREDMGTPVAASEVIHQHIPGSSLVVIEDASHQVALEKPEEFNATILEFLNE